MIKRFFLLTVLGLCAAIIVRAQKSFSYSPAKPVAGEKIIFSYTPPKNFATDQQPLKCVAWKVAPYTDSFGLSTRYPAKPVEINLIKKDDHYEGELATDSINCLITFSFTTGEFRRDEIDHEPFYSGGKADTNDSCGYFVQLYGKEGKVRKYGNLYAGQYVANEKINGLGFNNLLLAVGYYEKEMALYPDMKRYLLINYMFHLEKTDSIRCKAIAEKETEALFAAGLNSEYDLSQLGGLSVIQGRIQQMTYYYNLAREQYGKGNGAVGAGEKLNQYFNENDPSQKEKYMKEFIQLYNGLSYDEVRNMNYGDGYPPALKTDYLKYLVENNQFDRYNELKKSYDFNIRNNYLSDKVFENIAQLFLDKKKYAEAEELISEAYNYYKNTYEIQKANPKNLSTQSPADDYRTTAMKIHRAVAGRVIFADLYARLCIQTQAYKKGFTYAKDAVEYLPMLLPNFSAATPINSNYISLAEKILPEKNCKTAAEKIVATGFWSPDVRNVLKRMYEKKNGTDKGFDEYFKSLQKNNVEDESKSLEATKLNEAAPMFSLKDMEGKTVSLADLKGKIVVIDFWATWCGSCLASFPGMQQMVNYYKDKPDVQFLFVDTYENVSNDKIAHVLNAKNYQFHVLLDSSLNMAEQFKVGPLPTKFIIDKEGNIRYKIIGYESNEGKLFNEMNTMIESIK